MEKVRVETDVLCVGGGIAGLMAAIKAAELGAKVVVAEKGNTKFSGAGRAGNDHFWCYIPEFHGPDIDGFIRECMLTQLGERYGILGRKKLRTMVERSFEIIKLWDSWGIPMKYEEKWEFSGHTFPGHTFTNLKYSGHNQKKVLTKQATDRGTQIMNRVMVFELLGNSNGVTGALGIDTREDRLIEFQAKSVLLGTGSTMRMFPPTIPTLMGNMTHPFTLTGDGRAMAYRLGAELFNVEMFNRHVGVKNYVRAGQGTWLGVYRYPDGKPIGKYTTRPDKKYGDILPEVDKQIFSRIMEAGKGPVYMDFTGASKDDIDYFMHWMSNEGNDGLLNHMKEDGIELRKNPVEFQTYGLRQGGGMIFINEKAATSVKGLYSAGNECTADIAGAAIFGWIAGESIAEYIKGKPAPAPDKEKDKISEKENLIETLQTRKYGHDWKDANVALNHVMFDYAGLVRSEAMLAAGLNHLRRLRKNVENKLIARNRWELTRCLEVLNLYELGELVFLGARERTESRGYHRRVDYPLTDPLLSGKLLVVKKINGKPVFEWRETDR